jgi:hypothetical protein
MPNRVVRDGLLSSDQFNALDSDSQMCFVRLLMVVDDYGRFDGRDMAIKSAAYPMSDIRLTVVSKMLTDLVDAKMLQRYEVDGRAYISIPKFDQRLRQKRERYPAPPEFLSDSDSDSDSDSGKHACNGQTDDRQLSDNGQQETKKPKETVPPTIEEVRAYCADRKNMVDPQRWHDFYSSKGWMIGKNKIKDWQAAVRTWESKDKPKPNRIDLAAESTARYVEAMRNGCA